MYSYCKCHRETHSGIRHV